MATSPKDQNAARPARKVNNIYQRLEDARARREQIIAQKPPTDTENSAPQEPVKASAKLRKPSFPEIVMPAGEKTEAPADKPDRSSSRFAILMALLLAAALAVLAFLPAAQIGPRPAPTVDLAPAPQDIPEAPLPSTQSDARPVQTQSLLPGLAFVPSAPPPFEASLPKPRVGALHRKIEAPDATVPIWPPVTQASFLPQDFVSVPTMPAADFTYALRQPVLLTVSLNIQQASDREEVALVTRTLEESGHQINPPRTVQFVIRNTQVRFYHERDADSAARLADNFAGELRDFTDFRPSPPQGFVEIFVAGSGAPQDAPETSRGLGADLRQLGNNISNALRAITR